MSLLKGVKKNMIYDRSEYEMYLRKEVLAALDYDRLYLYLEDYDDDERNISDRSNVYKD